jgi:hypothetical protein
LPKRRESNPTGRNNRLVGGEKWSLSKTGVAVEKLAPRKVSEKLCVRKPYPAAPGSETAPFQNPSRNGTCKRLTLQHPARAISIFQKDLFLEETH